MKLNYVNDVVSTFGAEDTEDYTIAASAKMYHILSNGLYSNKILAVIREITCNAYDSHIVAGKRDVPVEVHLPTNFEPWFSVKDQGIGMDYETAKTLYTTYGRSTKTDSNDVIGALGLGSKSPFAYTSSFTVTAIKNGQKNVFSAYMRESGKPGISHMASTETDEPNGVTVNIPVKLTDIAEFRETAASCFYWFDVKPITNINLTIRSPFGYDIKFIDIADGAKGSITTNRYTTIQWFARQGVVGYPIDTSMVKDRIDPSVRTLAARMHLIVDFDIGSLDIAPSREALSYDKNTVNVIVDRLNAVLTQAQENIKEMFGKEELYYDACANYISNMDFAAMVDPSDLVHRKTGRKLVSRLFVPNDFPNVNILSSGRVSLSYSNRVHGDKYFYSKEHSTFNIDGSGASVPMVYVIGTNTKISANQAKRRIQAHHKNVAGQSIGGRMVPGRGNIGYVYEVQGNSDVAVTAIRDAVGLEENSPFVVDVNALPAIRAVRNAVRAVVSDYTMRDITEDKFVKGDNIEHILDNYDYVIKLNGDTANDAAILLFDTNTVSSAIGAAGHKVALVKEYKTRPLDVEDENFISVDDYLLELYQAVVRYVEDNSKTVINYNKYINSVGVRSWLHDLREFAYCMSPVMTEFGITVPSSYNVVLDLNNKLISEDAFIASKAKLYLPFIEYMNQRDSQKYSLPACGIDFGQTYYTKVQDFLDDNGMIGYNFPDVQKIKLINVGRIKSKSDCEFVMKII